MTTGRLIYRLTISIIVLIIGVIIIGLYDGYYDALGVFLMMWSDNIAKDTKR